MCPTRIPGGTFAFAVRLARIPAGRRLARNKSQPNGKIAPMFEGLSFADRRDQSRSDQRTDAGSCRKKPRI